RFEENVTAYMALLGVSRMLAGWRVTEGASGRLGETLAAKLTSPWNPSMLVNCSWIVTFQSWRIEYEPQRRAIKSGFETGTILTGDVRCCDTAPIVAVMVYVEFPGVFPAVSRMSRLLWPPGF